MVKLKDGDMLLEIKKWRGDSTEKRDVVQLLKMLWHNVQVLVDTLYSARYEFVPHHARQDKILLELLCVFTVFIWWSTVQLGYISRLKI